MQPYASLYLYFKPFFSVIVLVGLTIMGELVASAVVDGLHSKLRSAPGLELGLLWNFNNDLEEMKSTLESIQAILNDAEKRSFEEESVRLCLKELKAAAYDIEDMLDELPTQTRKHSKFQVLKSYNVKSCFSIPVMAHKLKGMKKRLDKIAEETRNYLMEEEAISYEKEIIEERKTTSEAFKDDVLGRNQEATQIINRLLMSTTTNESTALSVIPIVGIEGIGKTTLAKLIFDDDRIKKFFELRIWVHAMDLKGVELVEEILLSSGSENRTTLGKIQSKVERVQEILNGRRYLIVLDNVWNEDPERWEAFKQVLNGGKNESKILVTTRSESVSSIMDATATPHKLKPLSYNVCLELFQRRAFGLVGAKHSYLASIGREIVHKCKGVPLTANALGGMLHYFKRGEAAWKKVRDSYLWESRGKGNATFLRLSYQFMPSPLKLCFIYCSSFPKAFKLEKDMLIQQWIAQRFIQTEDEVEALQIGDYYVNYLLSLSFLEETRTDTYQMQASVYDLARWFAGDEVSIIDPKQSAKTNVEFRYASLIGYDRQSRLTKASLPTKVRALRLQSSNLVPKIFSYTKHLRVLELSKWPFGDLPTSIYKLKQLRYLKLDGITRLHERIKELQTLESLIISSTWFIHVLPESIGELHNLVYLCISDCSRLLQLPNSIGNLKKLNYLKLVGCCSLGSLPESLGDLGKLRTLKFINCSICSLGRLGDLVNLRTLKLINCSICSLPILDRLVNLISLDLSFSSKLSELPSSIGIHQQLETLELAGCISLRSLPVSVGQLWKLRILDIQGCLMLHELPEAIYTNKNLDIKGDKPLILGNDRHVKLYLVNGGPSAKYVVHNIGDAKRTNLEGRRSIESLTYECTHKMGSNLGEIEEAMMEELKPPENLQELCIRHYSGSRFSSWMKSSFPNLIKIRLSNISACPNLPVLGNLPNLEEIFICEMPYVTSISADFCGAGNGGSSVPSLKTLQLRDMENLEEWQTAEASEWHRQMFPRLEHLTMYNCPKLRVQPCIPTSVRTLELGGSALPILTALDGGKISLKSLRINELKDMIHFPENIASLTSLETLVIKYCKSVATLPEKLGKLSSLKSLKMDHCPLIDHLPQSIQSLKRLQSLVIIGCSETLFDRTREERGEDWNKISHIEDITINHRLARRMIPTAK